MSDTPNRSSALGPTDPVTLVSPAASGLFGDFVVAQKLGEGGMGAVFLAEDTKLGRKVAIKTMRPEIAAQRDAAERFLREARAAAAVDSDFIVPILHIDEAADGTPFIVMPFLKGESLGARLKRARTAPLDLVLKVAREVAEGLAAAHAVGLVHRDIKPANIWLEGDPAADDVARQVKRCKILDFGLARPVDPGAAQLTGTGAILGTPAYMAPEQARGEKVDARADLFSLGATLYRMATGQRPFTGDTPLSVAIAVATAAPRPVRELAPGLPPDLAGLVDRLMCKDRDGRPRSAAEVAALVRAIAEAQAAKRAEATAPLPPAPDPDSTSDPQLLTASESSEPTAPEPVRTAPKRVRLAWLTATAACLLVVPPGLWLAGAFGEKRPPEVTKNEGPVRTEPPATGPVQPVADPDRRAAEHVLSLGGSVGVHVAGEHREVGRVEALPTEAFRLTAVRFPERASVGDADLAPLKDCRGVMLVTAMNTSVGDAGVANLAGCRGLQFLYLHNTKVGPAGVAALKDCNELRAITLGGTQMTDPGLTHLKRFVNLESLDLRDTAVTADGVLDLAKALPGCEITWNGGVQPAALDADRKAAEWVFRNGGWVQVDGEPREVRGAADLPKGAFRLTGVHITDNLKMADADLSVFQGCRHITCIEFDGSNVGNKQVAHFKHCTDLRVIDLGDTEVGNDGFAHFKNCKNVVELDLEATGVDDRAVEQIKGYTRLTLIDLRRTAISAKGIAEIKEALPKCRFEPLE